MEKLAHSFPGKLETLIRKHEMARVDIKNINSVASSLSQKNVCVQKNYLLRTQLLLKNVPLLQLLLVFCLSVTVLPCHPTKFICFGVSKGQIHFVDEYGPGCLMSWRVSTSNGRLEAIASALTRYPVSSIVHQPFALLHCLLGLLSMTQRWPPFSFLVHSPWQSLGSRTGSEESRVAET